MHTPINAFEETETARKMFLSGSTRGMVDAHLQCLGLSPRLRAQIVVAATKSLNKRARMKSALVAMGGAMLVSFGGFLLYVCMINLINGARIPATIIMAVPATIIMAGLLLLVFGLHGATQNRI